MPLPNGLVPQAPVHTDSLTDYQDQVHVVQERSDSGEVVERRRKTTVAVAVSEQRMSHFLMGMALIGTMTGPLLVALHTMPQALFAGVFFVVGWGSIEGNDITHKVMFLLKDSDYIDPSEPLLQVRKRKIMLFLLFSVLGVGFSVAISQTIGAIGFPVIILSLIPLRWLAYPRWFSREELAIMDHLTADGDVVMASMGGKPELPEVKRAEQLLGRRNIEGEQGTRPAKDAESTPNDSSATVVGTDRDRGDGAGQAQSAKLE